MVKNPPAMQETRVWSLDWEDPLEKGTAIHCNNFAQRIPWTGKSGGIQSMGSQGVRYYWETNTHTHHTVVGPSKIFFKDQFSSVQLLSHVRLFATPWTAARQASLSITNSQSSLKLTSIESVMPSSHLILCRPLFLLPPIPGSFPMSQHFAWGGQSTGVSALASFLPKYTQDWSPLEWTGWISLQSKGPSRVFSNTTVQKHQFFGAQLSSQSNSHIHTWLLEKP